MEKYHDKTGNIHTSTTLKVNVEKVDTIMDLCGELVVMKSQLEQHPLISKLTDDTDLAAILSLLGTTIRDVYQQAMSMRLVSIKPTLLRLERAVDDAAMRLGKEVIFEVTGEDLELDRSMIEQIADPLMHLCRNAVDHGIESEDLRKKNGKDKRGHIKLQVSCEGSKAIVEVIDDGNGISREAVLSRAVKLGLVTETQKGSFSSPQDIYELLFKPGFSTAQAVGEISGRGVGLDVVRNSIRNMRGDITVQSEVGLGSVFRLTIPLSSALTDSIVTVVQNQTFIFPLGIVSEFVSITGESVEELGNGQLFFKRREEFLPLYYLSEIFSLGERRSDGVALILRAEMGFVAVVVDRVIGQSQVVVKKVDESYHGNKLVVGAAVMGDGKVAIVLDTSSSDWKKFGGLNGSAA